MSKPAGLLTTLAEGAKWVTFGEIHQNDNEVRHVQVGQVESLHKLRTINGLLSVKATETTKKLDMSKSARLPRYTCCGR